ncbi:hypothetical protein [uncultured Enterovirga sp.]|uniref:hypothetical protein n=1 Tax=uncultured Enterovirga sp. TaxID=2026352 RepID=UPI0035CB8571
MASEGFLKKCDSVVDALYPEHKDALGREMLLDQFSIMSWTKKDYYVNCWHLNDQESAVMWKIYAPLEEAVCITTSYSDLVTCLPDWIDIGRVKYVDYRRDIIDPTFQYDLIMSKRLSFRHEREIRAVVWSKTDKLKANNKEFNSDPEGLIVPIDPSCIIKTVYLSPNSPPDFKVAVEGVLRAYHCAADVRQSEVNAPPAY